MKGGSNFCSSKDVFFYKKHPEAEVIQKAVRHGPFDIQGRGGLGFWSGPSNFFRTKSEQDYFFRRSFGPDYFFHNLRLH